MATRTGGMALVLILAFCSFGHGWISPESAAYDPVSKRYFLSDQGNGNIVQVDSNGVQSLFNHELAAVKGLVVKGDTLFACGSTAGLFGFDLHTGERILQVIFPGQVDLNDVAADSSNYIYVSDAQGNQIFRVHLPDLATQRIASGFTMANGLYFDQKRNRMLACQWINNSPISAINLDDLSLSAVVNHGLDLLDGLTEDNAGNFYVSSFGTDAVYRYDPTFSRAPEVASSGYIDPGDIYYNKLTETLVVPNINGQRVDFVSMPVGPIAEELIFSDGTGGDGDGVLEGGETVEGTYRIINTRRDTLYNLRVDMLVDDPSLILLNGTSDFDPLAFGDTVRNLSDPALVIIPDDYPPRLCTVTLLLHFTVRGGKVIDSLQFEQAFGRPRIMLVDDDEGDFLEQYYIGSLSRYRVPCDRRTPPLTSGDLAAYDLVVWFTGGYRAAPLDLGETAVIREFLDGGGNLFLTGQGIAAGLNMQDQDFLNNYLKFQYLSTSTLMVLPVTSSAQVLEVGDTVRIAGSGGANNQSAPDRIAAVNGGVNELDYFSTINFGAVSFIGSYRMLFFSFGFEAIVNGDARWTDRDKIMIDILAFFACQLPPSPMAVEILPDDSMHMVTHVPTISWKHGDPGYMQTMYQVQIGTDADWASAETWDSGPVAGSDTLVVYAGPELSDGITYYVRVRVFDGAVWSLWYNSRFRMNSAPTAPEELAPNGFAEVSDTLFTLTHANSVDAEGDSKSYEYEVYEDSAMTALAASASGRPEGVGGWTSWQAQGILPRGQDYYWRVRAFDGFEYGLWSHKASFILVDPYLCGDANGDASANVGDAVFLISYIFKGGAAPNPLCVGDANGDGATNVGDAVYLISYIFKGGAPPAGSCCPSGLDISTCRIAG